MLSSIRPFIDIKRRLCTAIRKLTATMNRNSHISVSLSVMQTAGEFISRKSISAAFGRADFCSSARRRRLSRASVVMSISARVDSFEKSLPPTRPLVPTPVYSIRQRVCVMSPVPAKTGAHSSARDEIVSSRRFPHFSPPPREKKKSRCFAHVLFIPE